MDIHTDARQKNMLRNDFCVNKEEKKTNFISTKRSLSWIYICRWIKNGSFFSSKSAYWTPFDVFMPGLLFIFFLICIDLFRKLNINLHCQYGRKTLPHLRRTQRKREKLNFFVCLLSRHLMLLFKRDDFSIIFHSLFMLFFHVSFALSFYFDFLRLFSFALYKLASCDTYLNWVYVYGYLSS